MTERTSSGRVAYDSRGPRFREAARAYGALRGTSVYSQFGECASPSSEHEEIMLRGDNA